MKEVIRIELNKGYFEIYPNVFFPVNQTSMKKVLKMVDADTRHREQLLADMASCISSMIAHKTADLACIRDNYYKYHQNLTDFSSRLASGRQANGVRLTEDEYHMYECKCKHLPAKVNLTKRRFKSVDHSITMLKNDLATLNTWGKRR